MNRVEEAVAHFESGFACSQSILACYAPEFGMDKTTALKIACPFGGGIARTGKTCGAVTGAIMVIGLHSGITDPDDDDGKARTTEIAREFIRKFRNQYQTTYCFSLLDIEPGDQDGLNKAKSAGLTRQRCPKFVRTAATILESILF